MNHLSTTSTTTTTTTLAEQSPSASRASSFADFELLYEINMARRIFFKIPQPTAVTDNDDERSEPLVVE